MADSTRLVLTEMALTIMDLDLVLSHREAEGDTESVMALMAAKQGA